MINQVLGSQKLQSQKLECQALNERALEWYLDINDPDVSESVVEAWQEWLLSSAVHKQAFDEIVSFMQLSTEADVDASIWPTSESLVDDGYSGEQSIQEWRNHSQANVIAITPRSGRKIAPLLGILPG